jgi:hypothetical protein
VPFQIDLLNEWVKNAAMTAEIAVQNKHGVALAADSAITVRKPNAQKIYNSANKLFMLSKYHPVGVMVYGSASFMGIPWETIIKFYREELGATQCDKLVGFADNFFGFLRENKALFSPQLQTQELIAMGHWVLSQVKEQIDGAVKALFEKQGSVSDKDVQDIAISVIGQKADEWKSLLRLDCFSAEFEEEMLAKYSEELENLIGTVFGDLPIGTLKDKLLDICSCRVTREWWSFNAGGIVFAGFGKNDIFPSVQAYTVEVIVNDALKMQHISVLSNDMNETGAVSIMPYAQPEMVHRFIKGIDPEYHRAIFQLVRKNLGESYSSKILDSAKETLSQEQLSELGKILEKVGGEELAGLDSSISELERTKFVDPVLDIVGDLQKDDLAAMAESLVNLTSFKLKITAEAETVGGPIDVAVISKGDGFIWIKRKHYFNKDLNPSFFANYYRRSE